MDSSTQLASKLEELLSRKAKMEASARNGTSSPKVFLKKNLLGTPQVQNQNGGFLEDLHFCTLALDLFILFSMGAKQVNLRQKKRILNTKKIQKQQSLLGHL